MVKTIVGGIAVQDFIEEYKIDISPVHGDNSFTDINGEEVQDYLGDRITLSLSLGAVPHTLAAQLADILNAESVEVEYTTPVSNKAVEAALRGKAANSHEHNTRYYTRTVMDAKLDEKAGKDAATQSADGLMSAEDKVKLDEADNTYASKALYGDTTINVGRKAAMYYVCIKISFGADTDSFGCAPKGLDTARFEEIEKRLERVVIEHKDFEALIKQYDRSDALFYCDPPYHTTERHYSERFTEEDHHRLNAVLKALKGRFILSYNDDDFVRELYKDFIIAAVERQNNLSKGNFKEVIIKNF